MARYRWGVSCAGSESASRKRRAATNPSSRRTSGRCWPSYQRLYSSSLPGTGLVDTSIEKRGMGGNLLSTLRAVPGGDADVPLFVPKLGMAMTEATLLQWLAEEDAAVAEGDPLYVIETDKVEIGRAHV